MTRRQALLLRAFAIWTVYIWVTLVWNIWHDHAKGHGAGFKAIHFVLAAISITFAVAAWRVVTAVLARQARQREASASA
jgi:Zn-dependent protease with chaperone function